MRTIVLLLLLVTLPLYHLRFVVNKLYIVMISGTAKKEEEEEEISVGLRLFVVLPSIAISDNNKE